MDHELSDRENEVADMDASSEEWILIQELCAHRDRLRYRLEYQPLDTEESIQSDVMYNNLVDFFDSALRGIIANPDLNDLAQLELSQRDKEGRKRFITEAKALCSELNKLVDTDQADIKAWKVDKPVRDQTAYINLHALTSMLRNTTWSFELVAGQAQGLFSLATETIASSAFNTVSRFSSYMSSISRASLSDIPTSRSTSRNAGDDPHLSHYPLQALRGLLEIVPRLKARSPHDASKSESGSSNRMSPTRNAIQQDNPLLKDEHEHEVLLKLSSSPTHGSEAETVDTSLDLFLTTCSNVSRWQECHCATMADSIEDIWQDMDSQDLCDEIQYADRMNRRVCLVCKDGKMFATGPGATVSDMDWRRSAPGFQPIKSLRSLLDNACLLPTASRMGSTTPTLNLRQRRLLAARLATSLLVSLDCGYTLKSWDPDHVFFLIAPDGRYLLQHSYVSCIFEEGSLAKFIDESDFQMPIDLFISLARLLMEIEDGMSLHELSDEQLRLKIHAGLDQPAGSGYGSVYYVDSNVGPERTPNLERNDYLHALLALMEFDLVYKRAAKRSTSNNHSKTVRKLFCTEVVDIITNTVRMCDELGTARDSSMRRQASEQQTWSKEPLRRHHEPLISLFDDNLTTASDAHDFFKELDAFHESCTAEDSRSKLTFTHPSRPIRIAILDSGVNKFHEAIAAGFEMGNLHSDRCYNWVNEDHDNVHDVHGHGTNATSLLLRVAPEADLYVAKVFQGANIKETEIENIRKAINHAVNEWNVDIVSMSFGLQPLNSVNLALRTAYSEIEGEIESTDKMFFAAAGNSGDNAHRAFPADCGQVFGISASTGIGKDGKISPRVKGSEDNFMTLGISLPFIDMNDDGREQEFRSGTSYATPIAAGIAAHILHTAETVLQLEPRILACLRTRRGMREMFRLMANEADDSGYRYLAPWVKLWVRNWHLDPVKIQVVRNTILNSPVLQYIPHKKVAFA